MTGQTGRIVLRGEIDHDVADQLDEAVRTLLDTGARRLVVDFADLSFFDSACIGALVRAHDQTQQCGGELALVNVDRYARRVLDLTGLLSVFTVVDKPADEESGER
ncbi:MAG TPA: STAS domain-containing protein [Pseudonocardiaceae bacterium]|nr:STAS domain-containing protein [Pseudonocardiaceae bacterium]